MRILGIDPGVATTGWAIVESGGTGENGVKSVEYGVITTPKTDTHSHRLVELREDLSELMAEYVPEYAAVEKLYFATNAKTAFSVGEARGVILLAIEEQGISVYEYSPLQIKSAVCGYGKAPKRQVQEMVQSILGLGELPKPDDAADALAVGICCASRIAMENRIISS